MAEKIDEIRREVVLDAPIERVWEAVTSADEVKKWFGDTAEIDLRPGGKAKFGWTDFGSFSEAVVVEVDPPHRFSYSWTAESNTPYDETRATLVEYTLESDDDTTRLTMVESGFSRLPDEIYLDTLEGNTKGWAHELGELADFVAGVPAG